LGTDVTEVSITASPKKKKSKLQKKLQQALIKKINASKEKAEPPKPTKLQSKFAQGLEKRFLDSKAKRKLLE
jgi:hypothetical protein